MSIRAVTNPNPHPVQIQRDGVNLKTITELDARRLRDDLNRVLGVTGEHEELMNTVLDAAKAWERAYAPLRGRIEYLRNTEAVNARVKLSEAVKRLTAHRPIPNFDTGLNGSAFYGPDFTNTGSFTR